MGKRQNTQTPSNKLNPEQFKKAAQRMMMGALAHQRASAYCLDNPETKPPSANVLYFSTVSFELILFSIEQFLRLLLLLQYSTLRPTHNIFQLYNEIKRKGRDGIGPIQELYARINALAKSKGLEAISLKDVHACLKKHDSSYVNFRYFGLDKDARVSKKWEMKSFEIQVLHCLALALLEINLNKMKELDIGFSDTVRKISEADMKDDGKQLLERMKERSTR